MDPKIIKKKIMIAKDIVSDEEEPIKTAAFQVIFSKLIDADQIENTTEEKQHTNPITSQTSLTNEQINLEKRKEELAKNCGITIKELDEVISIKNDMVQVIFPLTGNESTKQIIAAQCILVTYDIVFGKEPVNSSLLSKCIDYSGIGALNHLAENLKEHSDLFRAAGKGTRLDYRLTGPGRKSAYETIKKLAKGM
jgi:hypothetical protein